VEKIVLRSPLTKKTLRMIRRKKRKRRIRDWDWDWEELKQTGEDAILHQL
jgi:hypothetical protein